MGMVNVSELLINAESDDESKKLTDSSQNGTRWSTHSLDELHGHKSAR